MSRSTRLGSGSVYRRTVLKGIAASSVGVGGFAGSAVAKPGRGRGNGSCDAVVDEGGGGDYTSIQAAVDASSPGDTVCVQDGTYQEQVVIDKSLTLRAADGHSPTVVAPMSPDSFSIAESGPSWEPVVFAYGGTESGGEVSGAGTSDVTVSGLSIDGADRQPDAGRAAGVLARNVRGNVLANTVSSMGVGGKETFGVITYGAGTELTIAGNTVSGYERGGIGANGDGTGPGPTVDIRKNTVSTVVDLFDPDNRTWAPNGIQIGFGAAGRIAGNEVSDNRWSPDESGDWVASGIIVFESDDVEVMRNSVRNSDVGVSVGSWSWFLPSADNTRIVGNDVHEAHGGIVLQAVAWDGLSSTDPSVSNNKVVKNVLTDPDDDDDDVGVAIDGIDLDPDYDPILDANKVINNTITGFTDQIDDEGMGTKIHANSP